LCHGRSQEERQGHATGHDDGRYDGRGGHGPDGVQDVGADRRQGAVAEQNRVGVVRHRSAQETAPTATGWTRNRVGVPSLRP